MVQRWVPVAMFLVSSTASGCFCAGSPGVLVGVGRDSRFVTERATLVVQAAGGLRRIDLDGSGSRLIFAGSHDVHDVSADFRTWLLGDSETNLLVGDASTGAIRAVPALAKRTSDAALSPDGKRIAASRHSDFSLPQAQWKDDDTIFLIDVATLATEVLPPSSSDWPTRVQWAADGSALWLETAFGKPGQWITLADGVRHGNLRGPEGELEVDPRKRPTCPQTFGDDRWAPQLSIVDGPASKPRVLVRLEGRTRGFHDYMPDFTSPTMSPACKYVVFHHDARVFVADAGNGAYGPLIEGDALFFLPPSRN